MSNEKTHELQQIVVEKVTEAPSPPQKSLLIQTKKSALPPARKLTPQEAAAEAIRLHDEAILQELDALIAKARST